MISNNKDCAVNGAYVCPMLAKTCHTNQLQPNATYLLSISLLIKGANANAVYVNSIQLPNPKNISDTNITPNGYRNARLLLVRYGVRTASPSKGSLLSGKGSSLLITKPANNNTLALIVFSTCYSLP